MAQSAVVRGSRWLGVGRRRANRLALTVTGQSLITRSARGRSRRLGAARANALRNSHCAPTASVVFSPSRTPLKGRCYSRIPRTQPSGTETAVGAPAAAVAAMTAKALSAMTAKALRAMTAFVLGPVLSKASTAEDSGRLFCIDNCVKHDLGGGLHSEL